MLPNPVSLRVPAKEAYHCAAGVAGVEASRVADGGVEGVRLEEGALVFGVGEAPKVLRGRCCRPCNSFSASIANWNNLSTVLKSL